MSEATFNTVVSLEPSTAKVIDVPVQGSPPWSLVAIPVDSGGANQTNIAFSVKEGGVVEATPLQASTGLTDNQPNRFQQTVVVTRLAVTLTPGATPPDGGVRLQIVGSRS